MTDPTLFTGSLVRLRILEPEQDAALFARWGQNSEYQTMLDSGPANLWTEKQVREWFDKEDPSVSIFIIQTLADARDIGFIDLTVSNWTARDSWVGIGIGSREDWGKGYGTDAMNVLLRFAFAELNLCRVSLTVFGYNPRGLRSYEKAGFHIEGRARQYLKRGEARYDMIYMGILREAWEAQQSVEEPVRNKMP